jgi:hypothetical protein
MRNIFFIGGIVIFIFLDCAGQNTTNELKALVDSINIEKRLNKVLIDRKTRLEKEKLAESKIKESLNIRLATFSKEAPKIQKDIDSLTSILNRLQHSISMTNNEIQKLRSEQVTKYKDIKSEHQKVQEGYDELNKSVIVLEKERETKNDSLKILTDEVSKYNNIKSQFTQLNNEVSLLKSQIDNKEKVFNIKKDSLKMITTIWNNTDKLKDENKRNIAAIEQRLCQQINATLAKEDYLNFQYISSLRVSLDSINRLFDYKIQSNKLNQCKLDAEKYIAFGTWVQNSEKAIQSNYEKTKIDQLISQSQQLNNLDSKQIDIKNKYVKLLIDYCKTYMKLLDDNKYLNSLSTAEIIKKEINNLISNDYFEYPYIVSELKKKLGNTTYRCQFNHTIPLCDQ